MTLFGLAAALLLVGQATTGPRPRGDTALWLASNDYPTNLENPPLRIVVRVSLDVSAEGRVTGCSIVRPSRYASINETTCRALRSRGRFDPARNAVGRAVAGRVKMSVAWALPE